MNPIYIGTSGWSYPSGADKWRGIFYPPHVDELSYYAERLPAVEVNSTFYHEPDASVAHEWVRRTPADFRFAVKLFMKFTHPGMCKNTTGQEDNITADDIDRMHGLLDIIAKHGKLLALLVQYPDFHHNTPEHYDQLINTLQIFRDYPLAVEFRDKSWEGKATSELLQKYEAARVKVDSPAYSNIDTPDVSGISPYYRLHGRNMEAWQHRGSGNARYDYLYSENKIDEISHRLRQSTVENSVIVFFNNHPGGKALVNAVQMSSTLGITLPYSKFSHLTSLFPQLEPITGPPDEQLGLQLG